MTTTQPLLDIDRHAPLRQVAERQRQHLTGDHTHCRPSWCPAARRPDAVPR